MHIILRLFCEVLSRIAVEISFLLVRRHGVYAAASFGAIITSGYIRNDTQNFSSSILCMNITYKAQCLFCSNI